MRQRKTKTDKTEEVKSLKEQIANLQTAYQNIIANGDKLARRHNDILRRYDTAMRVLAEIAATASTDPVAIRNTAAQAMRGIADMPVTTL